VTAAPRRGSDCGTGVVAVGILLDTRLLRVKPQGLVCEKEEIMPKATSVCRLPSRATGRVSHDRATLRPCRVSPGGMRR
jgi:hypothetical protein